MSMSVKVTGVLVSGNALRKLGKELEAKLEKEVARAAIQTANAARDSIRQTGGGIVYEKYNPRRTHQASAAGQPPASDTGRLIGSITQEKTPGGWIVGSKVVYSKYLEYGTRVIAERPFFRPALRKARQEWLERVQNLVGKKNARLQDVIE